MLERSVTSNAPVRKTKFKTNKKYETVDALPTLSPTMISSVPTDQRFKDFDEPKNLRLEGSKGGGVFSVKQERLAAPSCVL